MNQTKPQRKKQTKHQQKEKPKTYPYPSKAPKMIKIGDRRSTKMPYLIEQKLV